MGILSRRPAAVSMGLLAAALASGCGIDRRTLSVTEPDAGAGSGAQGTAGASGSAGAAGMTGASEGLAAGSGGSGTPAAGSEPGAGELLGTGGNGTMPSLDAGAGSEAPVTSDASSPDPCATSPCVHGACSPYEGRAVCECEPGYDGPDCSTDIDDCAARPCDNGGRCIDAVAGFSCDCSGLAFAGPGCGEPRFGPLPPFDGPGVPVPRAVSADGGVIVGTVIDSESLIGSFRWSRRDGYSDLTPAMGTSVRDISDDGVVLLGVESGPAADRSYVWSEAGGPIVLPAPAGLPRCDAERLDADGSRVAGTCYDEERRVWNAVRWTVQDGAARVDALPNSLGGNQSDAHAIDADGTTIVGSSFAGGGIATRWIIDGEALPRGEDIGLLPNPGLYPRGLAVSADGRVVAGDDGSNAFIWTAELGMQLLPQPVPIDANAAAAVNDMDASGSVVVGCLLPLPAGVAFETLIWDVDGAHRLRDVLVTAGAGAGALRDWTLSNPLAISADGNTIVGLGVDPSGRRSGWVAHRR